MRPTITILGFDISYREKGEPFIKDEDVKAFHGVKGFKVEGYEKKAEKILERLITEDYYKRTGKDYRTYLADTGISEAVKAHVGYPLGRYGANPHGNKTAAALYEGFKQGRGAGKYDVKVIIAPVYSDFEVDGEVWKGPGGAVQKIYLEKIIKDINPTAIFLSLTDRGAKTVPEVPLNREGDIGVTISEFSKKNKIPLFEAAGNKGIKYGAEEVLQTPYRIFATDERAGMNRFVPGVRGVVDISYKEFKEGRGTSYVAPGIAGLFMSVLSQAGDGATLTGEKMKTLAACAMSDLTDHYRSYYPKEKGRDDITQFLDKAEEFTNRCLGFFGGLQAKKEDLTSNKPPNFDSNLAIPVKF